MDSEIKKILLAEDDPGDAELTLAALEDHLVSKFVVVDNGEEALDYLYRRGKFKMRTRGNPAVVFIDNKMPKLSGLEVLKTVKADKHLKSIPIVVLTSSRETLDLIEFYKHGVNAYVVKPVDFTEFRSVIRQLVAFWSTINESPPTTGGPEISIETGKIVFSEEQKVLTPHPVLGE
jgi:CheY-like chemotaxis protein